MKQIYVVGKQIVAADSTIPAREAARLRSDALFAKLDGRTVRARALNRVASRLERMAAAQAARS